MSAEEFFRQYVSKRCPVIIQGLPDDEGFKAQKWTDLHYLASKAGNSSVLVEPMHPQSHQFGTDVERVPVEFGDFLKSLQMDDGPHPYLTTQYAEQDLDAVTVLPPPADALADDYPRIPRLMGNLYLQQVNLWLGKSKEGSTSGLHHDFHDNLYCLLQGQKRFVLYPPSEVKHLYPYGKLDTVHENGLISYADARVRSDGLPLLVALSARVKALEQKLSVTPKGKGKSRENTKERQKLMDAYDEAVDELTTYALEDDQMHELEDEAQDDFDALMAGLEDGEELDDGHPVELDGDESDGDSDGEDEGEEDGGIDSASDSEDKDDEPSSFSRIPAALIHEHLKLPSTAVLPSGVSAADFPDLKKTPAPFVVELNAGEMLYLPASWWHEVTSSSGSAEGNVVHMAFNYWFYPPDQLDAFEEPYEDKMLWEYLRSKDVGSKKGDATGGQLRVDKRKAQIQNGTQSSKRSRQS
ncbi:hypothetical protein PHLCEN_2v13692 [Hermanssonia centrifuga]|uniref:JmjC domain-containing protein n=1 Tax=Hermanssonia centrifuga TaxID=98765 RepID=A0A2R6NDP5_9APHY|nr:hypothetical protein PHLCEN_2v13692 [Hermanssonia centrifuga]